MFPSVLTKNNGSLDISSSAFLFFIIVIIISMIPLVHYFVEGQFLVLFLLNIQGHKSYVPNMISGASQADIGVLVS